MTFYENFWFDFYKMLFRAQSLDRLSMKSDATGSVKSQVEPDITIVLSVGSLCSQCHRPLYEEEIMSGWSTEPSCMMTECPWCRLVNSIHFSPKLTLLAYATRYFDRNFRQAIKHNEKFHSSLHVTHGPAQRG